MGKTTDFIFGRYLHRVYPNKNPLKVLRKGSMGVSREWQGLCNVLRTPYYLRNG